MMDSSTFRAFIFQGGEGNDSVVEGFTILGTGDPGILEPGGTDDDADGGGTDHTGNA